MWATEGRKTTPLAGTVLADTGEMVGQPYALRVIVSANVSASVKLQHRNAENNANAEEELVIDVLGSSPVALSFTFTLENDERVRVVTTATVAGGVQAVLTT